MIDLYYWPTSNGQKIPIFLEDAGLAWRAHAIDINKGDQFKPDFLAISPNNKIPAIVDPEPVDGGGPLAIFESGAILIYLAEKTGLFLPTSLRGRSVALQWLFWQVGGLGPILGQKNHFRGKTGSDYAVERFGKEVDRLFGVLDGRLAQAPFVAGDYSIADMAIYPWMATAVRNGDDLAPFPHIQRWMKEIAARPAVERAYEKAKVIRP